jgi:HK97 family phage prohead protease
MEKESRFQQAPSPTVETREDGSEIISGLGVVFGQRSDNLGGFYEYIDKDAFNEADISDVVGLFNHNGDIVLGRSSSGTMWFTISAEGVFYEIDAPQTQLIRDMVLSPMKRGDIRGSSFAFTIAEDGDEWEYNKANQVYTRYVKKIEKLYDLSPVTTPAYSQTTSKVSQRSFSQFKENLEKQERELAKQTIHYRRAYAENRLRLLQ